MKTRDGKNYYSNSGKADTGGAKTGKLQKRGSRAAGQQGSVRFPIFQPSSLLIFFVGIVSTFLAPAAQSREINVAAVVEPRYIQLGEKARLDLTISGDTFIKYIEAPRFNFLPDFLAVPLDSKASPRLAADKIAVSMAWAYELIPQAVGDFSLPDVQFPYRGSTYFANPGSVRVSRGDTYHDPSTGSIHRVEAEVDPAEPYLSAPVTYTFRYLYTAVLPTQASPTPKLPAFADVRVEELPTLPLHTQQIRGKTFWVKEQTRRLYPQRTGQILIQPATLMLPVPRGSKTLKTEPLKLRVQPLPVIGKPSDFSGAVGAYEITAQVDRSAVDAGSALTLSLQISGRGNMQTVSAPKLPAIKGVVVNGPNSVDDPAPTSRTYAYALIPARTGMLRIPAIPYTYFDPSRAAYATAQTLPIPVSVRPNPNDLAEIDTDASPWRLWLILLVVLVLGLLVAGFFWYRAGFRKSTDASVNAATRTVAPDSGEPSRGAAEPLTPAAAARDALTALNQRGTADAATAFANTLAQVLYEYLENTFGLANRSIDTVREVCTEVGVSASVLEELTNLLTQCDYHRFAPVQLSVDERQTLIKRTESVISSIEASPITDNR